jgi:hypothetical protein
MQQTFVTKIKNKTYHLLFNFLGGGMRLGPVGRLTITGLLYQARMMDNDESRAVGGMIDRGNRSIPRKPVTVPLCPPQIPYDISRLEPGSPLWD